MTPIVSIVGKSDSGKTYLIERLVPALTQRGLRIATVKHDVHGFEIDHEGKDSWRHKRSGASTVVLSSPEKIAVVMDVGQELDLDEIRLRFLPDVDLILTEGYKKSRFPKVEVSLFGAVQELLCSCHDRLIAVVTNRTVDLDVPVFQGEDVGRLAEWLVERFLRKKDKPCVEVLVSGKPMALNPFVQKVLSNVLRALLSTLKGWSSSAPVVIRLYGEGTDRISPGGDAGDSEIGQ